MHDLDYIVVYYLFTQMSYYNYVLLYIYIKKISLSLESSFQMTGIVSLKIKNDLYMSYERVLFYLNQLKVFFYLN